MNNSHLVASLNTLQIEEPINRTPLLQEKEGELVTIISAIDGIQKSKEWSTLKTKVFNGLTDSLTKDLLNESRKTTPDLLRLSKLSGELKWAERFSDLEKFKEEKRLELTNIRKLLYGKAEKLD